MLSLFASAFVLGLIFNAAPGAVFAETVRRAARSGFRGALNVQLGSLLGDATWAIAGLSGVGLLLQIERLRLPIGIAGVVYLLWLSWDSWHSARGATVTVTTRGPASSSVDLHGERRGALRAGMMLSLTNPQNVAYWAALGSAMGAIGVQEPTSMQYGVFLAGFMASSLAWCFVCAGLVSMVLERLAPGWVQQTYRMAAMAFLVLALLALADTVRMTAGRQGERPAASSPG